MVSLHTTAIHGICYHFIHNPPRISWQDCLPLNRPPLYDYIQVLVLFSFSFSDNILLSFLNSIDFFKTSYVLYPVSSFDSIGLFTHAFAVVLLNLEKTNSFLMQHPNLAIWRFRNKWGEKGWCSYSDLEFHKLILSSDTQWQVGSYHNHLDSFDDRHLSSSSSLYWAIWERERRYFQGEDSEQVLS